MGSRTRERAEFVFFRVRLFFGTGPGVVLARTVPPPRRRVDGVRWCSRTSGSDGARGACPLGPVERLSRPTTIERRGIFELSFERTAQRAAPALGGAGDDDAVTIRIRSLFAAMHPVDS